ncbi:hypothetical protein BV22DRAFT_1051794 [Leucogyrophana mollusca]|uniref:Uncharacterized protein n=1 Tax=Leucogyrophana mollusca TaxID=85980 RepID=A0ACB8B0X7_9AGAM|nr:hypothetical protein BV22DRAFT_1051794 [Leucogyrophana mollusca]
MTTSMSSQSSLQDETLLLDGHSSMSNRDTMVNKWLPCGRWILSSTSLRRICYCLHTVLIALHVCLVALAVRHTEHSVVVPITSKSSMLTTALSVSLQAFYTLYTALLVYLTQRVSLSRRLSQRQMLTTIHDVTGAWGGLGAALDGLWQQTKVVASLLGVLSVTTYLLNISVLHIASSSIIQFQTFNNTVTTSAPTAVGWPDPWVNSVAFDWATISSLAPSVGNLSGLGNAGLANGIVYDVLLDNSEIGNVTVNATTINVDCALVAGLVYNFTVSPTQLHTQNGDFGISTFVPWKDQVLCYTDMVTPLGVLNFFVTTAIEGSAALLDRTIIPMNWTYYASPVGEASATIDMFWVTCNTSLRRTSAIVDAQSNALLSSTSEAPLASTWTSVSPESMFYPTQQATNETWILAPFSFAPPADTSTICSAGEQSEGYSAAGECGYQPSMLDTYLMQLLGMNASQINPLLMLDPEHSSNTTPSFTLSVDQMETALPRVLATTMWTAGQLGEAGGGFDHSIGSATITRLMLETRLNINWIPLSFALSASIILLILAIRMTHADSEHPPKASAVNSGGVLELIWLASRLPAMRDTIGRVGSPNIDDLRAAGRFDVLLADVGEEDLATKHYDDCECNCQGPRGVARLRYTSIPIEDPTTLRETITHRLSDDGIPFNYSAVYSGYDWTFTGDLTSESDSIELAMKRVHSEMAVKLQELNRFEALRDQTRRN